MRISGASPPTGACSASNPIVTADGNRIAGLPFADGRAHALLSALLVFRLLPHGFTNRELRTLVAELLGNDTRPFSAGQMT